MKEGEGEGEVKENSREVGEIRGVVVKGNKGNEVCEVSRNKWKN